MPARVLIMDGITRITLICSLLEKILGVNGFFDTKFLPTIIQSDRFW